jgi:hypothetical protein
MKFGKVNNLIECQKLLEKINHTSKNIIQLDIFEDPGFFFDYVVEYPNKFINFCEITNVNEERYEVLFKINKELKSKYFVQSEVYSIILNEKKWFCEVINKNKPVTNLTLEELKTIWENIESLSEEIESLFVNDNNIEKNNNFFKLIDYYEDMKNFLTEKEFEKYDKKFNKPHIIYADVEKAFELGRVYKRNNHFSFSGLQAFIPCSMEYIKIISVIFSSFNDKEDDIIEKLRYVNNGKVFEIIDSIRKTSNQDPKYYKNREKLLKHLERLDLCKPLL